MKKVLIVLSTIALLTACNDKKQDTTEPAAVEIEDTVATDNTEVAMPDASAVTHANGDIITVEGKVTEKVNGKDGYTATILTDEGKKYSATISIPNMENPKDFRSVEIGDMITVTGEVINLESDVLIKVTQLK